MQKIGDIPNTRADANGEFTDGSVAGGVPPTILPAGFFNTVQREMVNVVNGFGLEIDPKNDSQLLTAIQSHVQKKGLFYSKVNKQKVIEFTFNDFGRRVWVDNDSPSNFTLPDISNINSSGQTITLWNVKDTNIIISVGNSSNSISIPMSTATSITLKPSESIIFIVEQNKVWHASGNGVFKNLAMFGASLNQNGWKREPSGLLTQWGAALPSASIANITYPIAFSARPYYIGFGYRQSTFPDTLQSVIINDPTSTNLGFSCRSLQTNGAGIQAGASAFYWTAVGV
ncbi:gp53-like domain-containing protein [Limnobaculum xujianqingii]|uniref:gp53-like domain-containing protein n=1 Tax=Limnobaculum xujianqingii TaxID=2738837 RepID=UPI002AC33C5C|nr:hypothetical protein [Limnobaculum xujianqingii]